MRPEHARIVENQFLLKLRIELCFDEASYEGLVSALRVAGAEPKSWDVPRPLVEQLFLIVTVVRDTLAGFHQNNVPTTPFIERLEEANVELDHLVREYVSELPPSD